MFYFPLTGPKHLQTLTPKCKILNLFWTSIASKRSRGGVEDTRLEAKAKAKDTKKIRGQGQGQGQPFRGQTLSRPRTGMLEAKAKDQGHKAQVLSKKKKKVFTNIFQAISKIKKKKKGLHKNFSGDLQKKKKKGLHKNFSSDLHEKTLSKKFFNRSTKF